MPSIAMKWLLALPMYLNTKLSALEGVNGIFNKMRKQWKWRRILDKILKKGMWHSICSYCQEPLIAKMKNKLYHGDVICKESCAFMMWKSRQKQYQVQRSTQKNTPRDVDMQSLLASGYF